MKCVRCKTCGHESIVNEQDEFFRCSSCGSYNELNTIVPKSSIRCIRCNTPLDAKSIKDGVLECNHCHQIMTFPKDNQASNVKENIELGKSSLNICKFDQAYEYFTKAIELDPREPEGYFNRALARFNVQYLRDLVNRRMQPICHIVNDKKFSEDNDYIKALQYASDKQKEEYQRKAIEIDNIKKEFKKLEEKGITYDCFICVKVTDEYQNKTNDYQKAYDLYHNLKDEGINPFFSEASLKDCIGEAYEAHILYALYKAKCMLIVCSDESYLDTPWVKNEYTRYQSFIESKEKSEGSLCIVYNKKTIEHLPTIKNKLQGIDLSSMDSFVTILKFVKKYTIDNIENNYNSKFLDDNKSEIVDNNTIGTDINLNNYIYKKITVTTLDEYKEKVLDGYVDISYPNNIEQEIIEYLELNKDKNDNILCQYGRFILNGKISTSNNFKDAFDIMKSLAKKNNAVAQNAIGFCYDHGRGVTYDPIKAIYWCTKAAEQGYSNAQYNLGNCYYSGHGVQQDYTQAFKWYKKAAELGNADAQYQLAICYEKIVKDYNQAIYWYKKSVEQGHSDAQFNLGICYYRGCGVIKDYSQAFKCFQKAAEQGHNNAQYYLGECYYNGQGVQQDYSQAVYWYKKAADQGNFFAENMLMAIESKRI